MAQYGARRMVGFDDVINGSHVYQDGCGEQVSIFGDRAAPTSLEVEIFSNAAYRALTENTFEGFGPLTGDEAAAYVGDQEHDQTIPLHECLEEAAGWVLRSRGIRDRDGVDESDPILGLEGEWACWVLHQLEKEHGSYLAKCGLSIGDRWRRADAAVLFLWAAQHRHLRLGIPLPSKQQHGFAFRVVSPYWEDVMKEAGQLLVSRMRWGSFEGLDQVNEEFNRAMARFQERDFKSAVVASNMALEAILKAVWRRRGWKDPEDPSTCKVGHLVNRCLSEGLVGSGFHREWLKNLENLLVAGVPNIRNKSGAAHSDGLDEISRATVRLVLDQTAAAIVFLAEVGAEPVVKSEC